MTVHQTATRNHVHSRRVDAGTRRQRTRVLSFKGTQHPEIRHPEGVTGKGRTIIPILVVLSTATLCHCIADNSVEDQRPQDNTHKGSPLDCMRYTPGFGRVRF